MATESVATPHPEAPEQDDITCGLWLSRGHVLEVCLDRNSGFPPSQEVLAALHDMIRGLARASMAVAESVMTDESSNELWVDAAAGVGFTIMLLSQLADGVAQFLDEAPAAQEA